MREEKKNKVTFHGIEVSLHETKDITIKIIISYFNIIFLFFRDRRMKKWGYVSIIDINVSNINWTIEWRLLFQNLFLFFAE